MTNDVLLFLKNIKKIMTGDFNYIHVNIAKNIKNKDHLLVE